MIVETAAANNIGIPTTSSCQAPHFILRFTPRSCISRCLLHGGGEENLQAAARKSSPRRSFHLPRNHRSYSRQPSLMDSIPPGDRETHTPFRPGALPRLLAPHPSPVSATPTTQIPYRTPAAAAAKHMPRFRQFARINSRGPMPGPLQPFPKKHPPGFAAPPRPRKHSQSLVSRLRHVTHLFRDIVLRGCPLSLVGACLDEGLREEAIICMSERGK